MSKRIVRLEARADLVDGGVRDLESRAEADEGFGIRHFNRNPALAGESCAAPAPDMQRYRMHGCGYDRFGFLRAETWRLAIPGEFASKSLHINDSRFERELPSVAPTALICVRKTPRL